MYRETVHNIHENYSLWKKIIELDYELLGLADDVFVSPVRYYFSSNGFGIILSRDVLIVSGIDKNKVVKEILRLKRKIVKLSKYRDLTHMKADTPTKMLVLAK